MAQSRFWKQLPKAAILNLGFVAAIWFAYYVTILAGRRNPDWVSIACFSITWWLVDSVRDARRNPSTWVKIYDRDRHDLLDDIGRVLGRFKYRLTNSDESTATFAKKGWLLNQGDIVVTFTISSAEITGPKALLDIIYKKVQS